MPSLETAVHAVSSNGLPMIGKTRLPNLFLNTAPGAQGWINACGAGKSIARIVSGLGPSSSSPSETRVARRPPSPPTIAALQESGPREAAPPKAQTPINAQVGSRDEPVLHQLSKPSGEPSRHVDAPKEQTRCGRSG